MIALRAWWQRTFRRACDVGWGLNLSESELERSAQRPFRAMFYVVRDPLPRAVVTQRSK